MKKLPTVARKSFQQKLWKASSKSLGKVSAEAWKTYQQKLEKLPAETWKAISISWEKLLEEAKKDFQQKLLLKAFTNFAGSYYKLLLKAFPRFCWKLSQASFRGFFNFGCKLFQVIKRTLICILIDLFVRYIVTTIINLNLRNIFQLYVHIFHRQLKFPSSLSPPLFTGKPHQTLTDERIGSWYFFVAIVIASRR